MTTRKQLPVVESPVGPVARAVEPEDDDRVRGRTLSRKQMTRDLRRQQREGIVDPEEQALRDELEAMRPSSRSQCANGPRPCFFVSCKYHLYLDVNPRTGSVKLNFPDKELWELTETCALDVADRGGITLEEVGGIMNLTRERVRQVETRGLEGMKTLADDGLDGFEDIPEIE
ncbi:MAG: hypothetical protein RL199_477 [Pseudomonadota bacterium]